jgi:hypothetical protein
VQIPYAAVGKKGAVMTLEVANLEVDVGTACGKVARRPQVLIVSDMRLYHEATAAMLAATGRVEIVGMAGAESCTNVFTAVAVFDTDGDLATDADRVT